ncbi:ATP-binding protein [Paenibacillus aestuarii]|uniref:histidine kinase n=1 Tax=Paenibacillus aestuarii TaxID=516965 RepID=A0ABW0K0V0_9BACL|nr:ATP-binding protein [Paenibacillus aestuarii]
MASGSFEQVDDEAVPREAPKELQLLAEHFFRMATQIKENQQALLQLNAELEMRVEERTQSLLRKNQELEIVNTLLLPSIQGRAAGQHIAEALQQLRDFVQAAVHLRLAHTGPSTLSDVHDWESLDGSSETRGRADLETRIPVQTGSLVLGDMTVQTSGEESGQAGGHEAFLHTFANTVAIILQNDILLKSMQNEHATLNAVLESMSDAIVLVDVQHRVVYANHRMCDIFRIPMANLLMMSEQDLFHALSGMLSEQQADLHKLTQERSTQGTFTLTGSNGKERFLTVSAFEVSRENRVFGRGYVWRDMTKEHEIDALKNDLISLASHEFKTPITSIKGSVETLLRTDAKWEESFKQELLEGIHEDIGRIQDLIEEWLDISKIEAGAMRINPQPLRLADVVESARRRLPQQAVYIHTRFEVELDQELPLVYADKLRLEQVLINLFTNAVRYNLGQPMIRIRAKVADSFVRLEVEDNGIGIAAEHLDHIFDRFYRVDVSSIRQTGGTGLGLAICKGIMQAHGGDIKVKSEFGQGSTFTLLIPKYQGEEKG